MDRLANWLQVGANVGILLGLGLVALQMQQNADLTRFAIYSQHWDGWANIDRSLQSENFAETWAKSIATPAELTDAELLEIHGFLYTYMDQFRRSLDLYNAGMFGADPSVSIASAVKDGFGNPVGMAWWSESREEWDEEMRQIVDGALAGMPSSAGYYSDKLARVRARIEAEDGS